MRHKMSFVAMAMMILFLYEAGAQIRLQPPKISPPLNSGSTNLDLGSSNQPQGKLFRPLPPLSENRLPEPPLTEMPPVKMPEQNFSSGQLPPGVYQTEPYAGVVIVPGPEHDDSSVLGAGAIYPASKVPVIHPHIQVIPLHPARR